MSMQRAFFAVVLTTAFLGACNNDDEPLPDPTPEPPGNTVVTSSMHYFLGANAIDTSATKKQDFGTELRIERIRWDLAQPLVTDDAADTVEAFMDKYLLIDTREGSTVMTLGELSGHLHELHYGIGVNDEVNHADPDTMPAPLDVPDMHTGSQPGGYKFLVLEGTYDSNGSNTIDGSDASCLYVCSTDALYTLAELHTHEDADQGGNLIFDLELDVGTLINGIDVASTPNASGATATTQTLITNLSTSISVP